MCHWKTCADRLHVIIVMTAVAFPYSLASCLIRFTHMHSVHFSVSVVHCPECTTLPVRTRNCRLLQRHFRDVAHTAARITKITLSRMTCASRHFVPRIRHSLPMKKVKKVEKVKHFRTIHTLRSLPDQGEDVCKVWFRMVQKSESV